MYQGGTKLIEQSQQSPANLEYVDYKQTYLIKLRNSCYIFAALSFGILLVGFLQVKSKTCCSEMK
jgi:hypothetical protein